MNTDELREKTGPEPAKSYPPPAENPDCKCWPNPMATFFCLTGHLLECHYPLNCREARCGHLARYESEAE